MGKKVTVNVTFKLTFKLAFNLPEDCEDRSLIISWKRGSKTQNKGETKPVEYAKKKKFESKLLELELKEETKKKPLAKASIDLKEFAEVGSHDNETVPLSFGKKKKKEGGSGPALKMSCLTMWTHIGKKMLVKRDGEGQGSAVMVGDTAYDLQTASELSEDETTLGDGSSQEFEFSETESDEDEEGSDAKPTPKDKNKGTNRAAPEEDKAQERGGKEGERKSYEQTERERRSKEKRAKEKREKDRRAKDKKEKDKKREADKTSEKKKEEKPEEEPGVKETLDLEPKAKGSKRSRGKKEKDRKTDNEPTAMNRGEEHEASDIGQPAKERSPMPHSLLDAEMGDGGGSARRGKRKTSQLHTARPRAGSTGEDDPNPDVAAKNKSARGKSARSDTPSKKSGEKKNARGDATSASAMDIKTPVSEPPVITRSKFEDEGPNTTESDRTADILGAFPPAGRRLARVEKPPGPSGRRKPIRGAVGKEEDIPPERKPPLPDTLQSGNLDIGENLSPASTASTPATLKFAPGCSSPQLERLHDELRATRELSQRRLDRINGLLEEIETLKAETAASASARTVEYSRGAQLKSLESQLATEQATSDDLRQQLDNEQSRSFQLEQRIRTLEKGDEAVEERVVVLQALLDKADALACGLRATLDDKVALIAEAESKLKASQSELDSLRLDCSTAYATARELERTLHKERKEKKNDLALLEAKTALVEELNASLREERTKYESIQLDKRALDSEVASLEEELEATSKQLMEAMTSRSESLKKLSSLQEECATLEAQLAAEARKVERLTSQVEESRAQTMESALKAEADGDNSAALELELLELKQQSQRMSATLCEAVEERDALTNRVTKLKAELKNALTSAEDNRGASMNEIRSLKEGLRSAQAEALRAGDALTKAEHARMEAETAGKSAQEAHDVEKRQLSKDLSRAKSKLKKAELVAATAEALLAKGKRIEGDLDRRSAEVRLAEKDTRIAELAQLLENAESRARENMGEVREPSSGASGEDDLKLKIHARRQQQDIDHLKSKVKALEFAAQRSSFIAEHVFCLRYGDWENGILPSARAIVLKLSEWKVFDGDDSDCSQGEFVNNLVSSLKKGFAACPQDPRSLIGWLSFLCCLHDLLENEVGTTEDEDRGDIPNNGIYIFREHEEVDDDLLAEFFHELELVISGAYSSLIKAITEQLAKRTVPGIFDKSEAEVIHPISACYDAAIALHLFPSVRIQLFGQLFSFINARAVNMLLSTPDLCTCGSGFTIKLKLSEIEEFLADNDKQLLPLARHHLTHLREMATMLVVDKSICSDEEAIQSVFPTLSLFQLRRVLEQYTPDDYSPEPVSADVLQFLENLTDHLAPPASVALDEYDILPLGRDFMKM